MLDRLSRLDQICSLGSVRLTVWDHYRTMTAFHITHFDVAIGDAQAVAELHGRHQLLHEPGGFGLRDAVQLRGW